MFISEVFFLCKITELFCIEISACVCVRVCLCVCLCLQSDIASVHYKRGGV